MKMLEKSMRWGMAALVVGVLAAVGLVVAVLHVQPAEATFPGKNGRIAYVEDLQVDNRAILTIKPSGAGGIKITDQAGVWNPSFSPDGKKIAYSALDGHGWEIYTINATGGKPFQVTHNRKDDLQPSWGSRP
jgi:TolB protein